MDVEDYHPDGKGWGLRPHEKGGKFHEVPAHHKAEEHIAEAAVTGEHKAPLSRSVGRDKRLTRRRVHRREMLAMIKRRTRAAGLPDRIGCHTLRARRSCSTA